MKELLPIRVIKRGCVPKMGQRVSVHWLEELPPTLVTWVQAPSIYYTGDSNSGLKLRSRFMAKWISSVPKAT